MRKFEYIVYNQKLAERESFKEREKELIQQAALQKLSEKLNNPQQGKGVSNKQQAIDFAKQLANQSLAQEIDRAQLSQ